MNMMTNEVLKRIAEALERIAASHEKSVECHEQSVANSRELIAQTDSKNIWKDQYEKVYDQNTELRKEVEAVRSMALRMGESFRQQWDECHDGSDGACCKTHEGDER